MQARDIFNNGLTHIVNSDMIFGGKTTNTPENIERTRKFLAQIESVPLDYDYNPEETKPKLRTIKSKPSDTKSMFIEDPKPVWTDLLDSEESSDETVLDEPAASDEPANWKDMLDDSPEEEKKGGKLHKKSTFTEDFKKIESLLKNF